MAAHIKTVLEQTQSKDFPIKIDVFKHGMSYALFGDNLHQEDWYQLYYHVNDDAALVATGHDLYPKYVAIWKILGEPATAEEWQKRYYGEKHAEYKHLIDQIENIFGAAKNINS